MRQGKLLLAIVSLVGMNNVFGQSNTFPVTGSVGIGITPVAKLQVLGTASLPSAIFTVGKVGIGGLATSFSSAALPASLLSVADGNMSLTNGNMTVTSGNVRITPVLDANGNTTACPLFVYAGVPQFQGGIYVGTWGPGIGSYMKYSTSLGTFEINTNGVNPNNYNFRIGSLINNVDKAAPVLASPSDLYFRTNADVGTAASNFHFFTGNTELVTLTNTGNMGIGTPTPGANLDVVGANKTLQLRLSPVGGGTSATSIPSYIDMYSTFDKYASDQRPRRTATIKAAYSGGAWGNEALIFGVAGSNDAGSVEPTERMRISGNGYVGIGTTTPAQALEVLGNMRLRPASFAAVGNSTTLELGDANHFLSSTWNVGLKLSTVNSIVLTAGTATVNLDGTTGNMKISGRVDIGGKSFTPTDATVKLAVAGTIAAQKLKCVIASNWGDYVFDKSYTLQPLAEVEQYINAYKHLPNIPSATELEKEGLDTGEMLRLQMIKIEELTLHLIKLQKEVATLKKANK